MVLLHVPPARCRRLSLTACLLLIMAPASEPLTEKAFQKMPLDFVGPSILRWGGDKSTQLEFNATARGWETNKGTTPPVRLRPLRPFGQPWF